MIGQRLANRYDIAGEVGRGGMGIVYKARDIEKKTVVVVKTLPTEMLHHHQFLLRFKKEAKALAALDHSNIVKLLDTFRDKDVHFIVMEFIDGQPLSKVLDKGLLPLEKAQQITLDVCAALSHAHEERIVHRDIKPSNIMVTTDGEVKITDFGIARIVDDTVGTLTGTSLGTAEYMSPEQVRGEKVDERSDTYSLGVVLYQMLTGKVPFAGTDRYSTGYLHLHEEPEPAQQLNPELPEGWGGIVRCALAKGRHARYQTAQEFADDLLAGGPSPEAKARAELDWRLLRTRRERKKTETLDGLPSPRPMRWRMIVVALVIFLVVVGGGMYAYREMQRTDILAQHYEQGLDYLQARKWELAIGEFEAVTQLDPRYRDTAGRREEAEARLAEDRRQQALAALLEDAKQAMASASWPEAIALLEQLQDMNAGHSQVADLLFEAHSDYGLELVESSEFEGAVVHFDNALELQPDDATATRERGLASSYLEGMRAFGGEDWQRAIASFSTVYNLRPAYADVATYLYQAYCNYGDVLLAACELEDAAAHFRLASAMYEEGEEAQRGLQQAQALLTPRYTTLTVASRDFTSTQGRNNWYYLEWTGSRYEQMEWNSRKDSWRGSSAWWVRWEANGGHPDTFRDVARKWVSPISGTLRISGSVYKMDITGGNGVNVQIMKNSAPLWHAPIRWYDHRGSYFTLTPSVQVGDALYFTISSNRNAVSDMTYFNPTIELLEVECSE